MTKKQMLDRGLHITESIFSQKIETENEIGWIGKVSNQFDGIFHYSPLANELYEGNIGIALTLLHAHHLKKNEEYVRCVKKILNQSIFEFYQKLDSGNFDCIHSRFNYPAHLSFYAFPTCIIYLMIHISNIVGLDNWDEIFFKRVMDWVESSIEQAEYGEQLLGLAGLIMILNTLRYEKHIHDKKRIKTLINTSAKRIIYLGRTKDNLFYLPYKDRITNRESSLGGYSHGSAGVAIALLIAYNMNKDKNILEFVHKALNHDESFYDVKTGGWRDARMGNLGLDNGSWCHGSAGIGLSKLLLNDLGYPKSNFFDHYQQCVNNILNNLDGNDCICHGRCSHLDIVISLAKFAKDEVTLKVALDKIECLIEMDICKFQYSSPQFTQILGLFTGLSGTAYSLFRFYDSNSVPSVLAGETPNFKFQSLR